MMYKILNYIFILLFAAAAFAQYNDVDAMRWILVYTAAAVIAFLYAVNKLGWIISMTLAVICLVWALFIVPDLTMNGFVYIFDDGISMKQVGVEASREFLGLMIIASWMFLLTNKVRNEVKQ